MRSNQPRTTPPTDGDAQGARTSRLTAPASLTAPSLRTNGDADCDRAANAGHDSHRAPGQPRHSGAEASDGTDATLLLAYVRGDAHAFELLYRKHRTWLYQAILRQVVDANRSQEIFQEVWLTVIRNAAEVAPQSRFPIWIYSVARAQIVAHWRLPSAALNGAGSVRFDRSANGEQAQTGADPATTVATAGLPPLQARLLAALEAMPPLLRETFLLTIHAGLTLAEVSQATGSSMAAAKGRLSAAQAHLLAALEQGGFS